MQCLHPAISGDSATIAYELYRFRSLQKWKGRSDLDRIKYLPYVRNNSYPIDFESEVPETHVHYLGCIWNCLIQCESF